MFVMTNSVRARCFGLGCLAIAALFVLVAGSPAHAQVSCSDPTYGTSGTYSTSTYAACTSGNTQNAPGTVVTGTATLRAATAQTFGLISGRIAAARSAANDQAPIEFSGTLNNGLVGLSAGDHDKKWGVWLKGGWTHVDDSNTATSFDGDVYSILGGVDYRIHDRVLIGLSGGYEKGDLDTSFNRGEQDSDGFLVVPYVSFEINKTFSVDAYGGYANLDYDLFRRDPVTNERFDGDTDADRWFGGITGNGGWQHRQWRFGANLGAFYSREKRDGFTETGPVTGAVTQGSQTTKLGQARLGGRVGYAFERLEPFAKARYEYDFTKSSVNVAANQTRPSDDDHGLGVGGGIDFDIAPNVTAGIEGEAILIRDDFEQYSGTARIRIEF